MTIEEFCKRVAKLGLAVDESSGQLLVEWEKIPFSEKDRPYWAALSSVDGIGPQTLPVLIGAFGSARSALATPADDLQEIGLSASVAARVVQLQQEPDPPRWYARMTSPEAGIELKFIVPTDEIFPRQLRQLSRGPAQLWVWGDPALLSAARLVAVVGTRKITPYGREVTTNLCRRLATAGCTVVSGLMYGVDEVAMRAALASGGKVIGVWAGGLTRKSLGSRFRLASDIVARGGTVISEFAPDRTPLKGLFPARNRIVAALSRVVVVTEGAVKSGSLITALHALEQGRPVGAVPGPITSSLSMGTNELLKHGAAPITSVGDILSLAGISTIRGNNELQISQFQPRTDAESKVLLLLSDRPRTIDELSRELPFSIAELTVTLTSLELAGVAGQAGDEWSRRS